MITSSYPVEAFPEAQGLSVSNAARQRLLNPHRVLAGRDRIVGEI
jgi:hypothetical protein